MNLFIESIFIILLTLCICYLWRLNNKIMVLQKSKNDLINMINGFNDSIIKAEKNISELKYLATNTQSEIKTSIDKAKFLSDDLSFMTERAGHLADKLENMISISRNIQNSLGLLTDEDYKNSIKVKQDEENLKKRKATIENLLKKISGKNNKKLGYSESLSINADSYEE